MEAILGTSYHHLILIVLHIELNILHIESRSLHDNAGSTRKQLHISYDWFMKGTILIGCVDLITLVVNSWRISCFCTNRFSALDTSTASGAWLINTTFMMAYPGGGGLVQWLTDWQTHPGVSQSLKRWIPIINGSVYDVQAVSIMIGRLVSAPSADLVVRLLIML